MTGPRFLSLHSLSDEIAADTRTWADQMAERALALDVPVDARPATVAATGGQFPAGRVPDQEAVEALTVLIDAVVSTARDVLDVLETTDPVGHDLTVEVLQGLEKYIWLLRAQHR